MDLLKVLEILTTCIKGKWFVGDGALLGLIREGKLIDYDNDIDLYILEDTEIDLSSSVLEEQDYYLCKKIYNPNNKYIPCPHIWNTYLSSLKPMFPHYDQRQLFEYASPRYPTEKIVHKFTENHIDIFTLYKNGDKWLLPKNVRIMGTYYTKDDLELTENNDLGFSVNIPNNAEEVLERQYGYDWRHPNKNFKYY